MEFQELINSVKNDVRQGAYDNEEILLLCDKAEALIPSTEKNLRPIYKAGETFRDKAKTDLIHTIIAISPKKDYEEEITYFVECEDENNEIHYDVLKESYLNEETTKLEQRLWSQINNEFEDEQVIFIDAWTTNDENEEGKVIAKVFKNEQGIIEVEYLDERAKTDVFAQEVIQESINNLKSPIDYIMVWIEEEEKWYYFINDFDTKQFPNGYVDYMISVKDGIIKEDNFKADTIGKTFKDCYQESYWNPVA
ncbi:hypothetical protein CVD28_03925 [Bacillus sp. M6-12]|uniref:hypothetical protein n=1 Tax=Bacillus sp. M6-12 TaxID=2054166 RepID=UPI000C76CE91|nr:hypothetical protein [Bacillus sp. M6-12]PLS19576.1 hypothetical protein CVD28_03925 [Bacillus sp. M6-12]